jgi:hypothetical protein
MVCVTSQMARLRSPTATTAMPNRDAKPRCQIAIPDRKDRGCVFPEYITLPPIVTKAIVNRNHGLCNFTNDSAPLANRHHRDAKPRCQTAMPNRDAKSRYQTAKAVVACS